MHARHSLPSKDTSRPPFPSPNSPLDPPGSNKAEPREVRQEKEAVGRVLEGWLGACSKLPELVGSVCGDAVPGFGGGERFLFS